MPLIRNSILLRPLEEIFDAIDRTNTTSGVDTGAQILLLECLKEVPADMPTGNLHDLTNPSNRQDADFVPTDTDLATFLSATDRKDDGNHFALKTGNANARLAAFLSAAGLPSNTQLISVVGKTTVERLFNNTVLGANDFGDVVFSNSGEAIMQLRTPTSTTGNVDVTSVATHFAVVG